MNTNKAINRLNKELAKKQDALANLEKKKADIEASIKDMKLSIAETNAEIEREKLDLLKDSAKAQGLNVDDLLSMLLGDAAPAPSAAATAYEGQEDDTEQETADLYE